MISFPTQRMTPIFSSCHSKWCVWSRDAKTKTGTLSLLNWETEGKRSDVLTKQRRLQSGRVSTKSSERLTCLLKYVYWWIIFKLEYWGRKLTRGASTTAAEWVHAGCNNLPRNTTAFQKSCFHGLFMTLFHSYSWVTEPDWFLRIPTSQAQTSPPASQGPSSLSSTCKLSKMFLF